MGKYRFKLSGLIPNAWFHKLRDMGKSTSKHQRQQNINMSPSPINKHQNVITKTARCSTPRRSSYYSRKSAVPLDLLTTSGDTTFSPEFRSDQLLVSLNSPCTCVTRKASTFTPPTALDLRPIITKPANKTTIVRKPAVRLRLRSPRISTRKSGSSGGRRSGSSTMARRSRVVVKASLDPRRDFRESMEEMIAENNIRESKDLEDLLACYLSLNSNDYHFLIINVFKQIWLDLQIS